MTLDPSSPVIIGVGQVTNRHPNPENVVDAIELMVRALERAADDAGNRDALACIDRLVVTQGQWRWPNPAALVADRVGAPRASTVFAMACGSTPQLLVHDAARRVERGDAQLVALCGGEWVHGRARLRALGRTLPVTVQTEGRPDEHFGHNRQWESDLERSRGFGQPLDIYGLFESALRQRLGEDVEANRQACSDLMSGLSGVAARHPYAWSPVSYTPAEIRDVAPGNRMVTFPYTKRMVSNWNVDMASALLITTVATASRLGVPTGRWVFPLGGADADDACFFSELERLDDSPAMRATTSAAYDATGHGPDDVDLFDLYSCFPAAIRIEAEAAGIGLDRPLTVTGGMPYFGGPMANYMGHAIATMVDELRARPGAVGCCVGNGGYLNKLSVGLYSTTPPPDGLRVADVSDAVRGVGHRAVAATHDGRAGIEAATVLHGRDGPARAIATGLTDRGARVLAWSTDDDVMARFMTDEWVGGTIDIAADGRIRSLR